MAKLGELKRKAARSSTNHAARGATPNSNTPAQVLERIEAAFKNLPGVGPEIGADRGIPVYQLIPSAARDLLIMGISDGSFKFTAENSPSMSPLSRRLLNETNQRNNDKPASQEITKKELHDIKMRAFDLLVALNKAHQPAISKAVGALAPDKWFQFALSISLLMIHAEQADISDIPDDPSIDRVKKGAVKVQPYRVALRTAAHYFILTGKTPAIGVDRINNAPSGPYYDLLKLVFAEKGMRASVEHAAKKAIATFQEAKEKKPETFISFLLVT